MLNDINWAQIETEYAEGWAYWATNGFLDSDNCRDGNGVRRSFEFREGYEAAAKSAAEISEASRNLIPTAADAPEAARRYLRKIQDEAYSDYCTFAD